MAKLKAIIRRLLATQRVLRARIVVLEGEVRDAADRVGTLPAGSRDAAPRDLAIAESRPFRYMRNSSHKDR